MGSITKAADVRRSFIEFFEGKGHTHVPSSPAVPHDDPTLMFANAGMNQFKPAFLGNVPAGHPLAGVKRATNTQKCIRAGGKHNDLDDVGRDTYHHTFFEMLGNWSFGDYFKQESIDWAWELLTEVWGMKKSRLYATYFGGDEKLGLGPDTEARDFWLEHLPADRVIPCGVKDNFWEMGDTGPCGPCSELHYDRIGGGRNAASRVNMDGEDVIEIWNLVFIQYDRQADGSLKALPEKHIDTGMGLERVAGILKGVDSNYDTDLFTPIFAAIERLTDAKGYHGKFGDDDADGVDTAYRVIADHVRTLTFALTDGAVPGNEGRGYVLRRILRRAVRYGRQTLGAKSGFFSDLVPIVIEHMSGAFPELKRNPQRVIDLILDEEESFGRTLDRGITLFKEAAQQAGKGGMISGEDAFKLYDTFGFPVDLTILMAEERGMSVDVAGFEAAMEEQKTRSRAGAKTGGESGLVLDAEAIAGLRQMRVNETDDGDKFHGREIRATVKAIWGGKNFDERAVGTTAGTHRIGVILNKTNFYSEMGGQVADTGSLDVSRESRIGSAGSQGTGGRFIVEDTRSFGGFVMHIGCVKKGEIRVGDDVVCSLDSQRRLSIASNHTATHLLNLGLNTILGGGVDQKGSLVDDGKLRFDFSQSGAVSPEQLGKVEAIVREAIAADLPVHADLADLSTAQSINGLRAVFGETYPDPVRVVSIGAKVEDLLANTSNPEWANLSIEFCGGTHLISTGQAGDFALVQEEAVAKGIRRVIALTGTPAKAAHATADGLAERIASAGSLTGDALKQEQHELAAQIDEMTLPASRKAALRGELSGLAEKIKKAEKAKSGERAAEAARLAGVLAGSAEASLDPYYVTTIEVGSDRGALQAAMKTITGRASKKAVMLLSPDPDSGKVAVMATVPKDQQSKLKAGDWVRDVVGVMGGKGGGKPDSAQGAGSDLSKVKDAIRKAETHAGQKLL